MAEPKERESDASARTPAPPRKAAEADLATLIQDWFRRARVESERRRRERHQPPPKTEPHAAR